IVTHDALDAAALADRIVVLERGTVTQTGTLAEISARPRSAYAADLVDANLVRGVAHHTYVSLASGARIVAADAGVGEVLAVIHPRSIALHRTPPSGSPRNVIPGRVESIDRFGDRVRVRLGGDVPLVAEITPAALEDLAIEPGAELLAAVKATDVTVFPA